MFKGKNLLLWLVIGGGLAAYFFIGRNKTGAPGASQASDFSRNSPAFEAINNVVAAADRAVSAATSAIDSSGGTSPGGFTPQPGTIPNRSGLTVS